MGARILPDSFDVVDDPTQKEWRGKELFGAYDVDREGVMAKPLHLVEKGALKSFLLTRQPVRGFEGSNGRARLPGRQSNVPDISNLFVTSSDATPAADMKKKLIELVQSRGKQYGIIVRKMDFPSTAGLEDRAARCRTQQGSPHPVSLPLLVYKVFPDGHEELVRGMQFHGLQCALAAGYPGGGRRRHGIRLHRQHGALRAGGRRHVFPRRPAWLAPSILIDDLELRPVDQELPKLPLVPAPEMVAVRTAVRLLGRYVFREILTSSLLGTVLATFIIFLQKADTLFKVLVGSSPHPATIVGLLALALPSVLPYTIPFGVLVGILIGLGTHVLRWRDHRHARRRSVQP